MSLFIAYQNVHPHRRFSSVGYSEEQARKTLGNDNVEVYHSRMIPLEEELVSRVNEAGETIKKRSYFKVTTELAEMLTVYPIIGRGQ